MRKIALALAAVLATSGPLLAKDVSHPAKPSAVTKIVKPAKRPVLDTTSTASIKPRAETNETVIRPRSGIAVNPWIVPSFH